MRDPHRDTPAVIVPSYIVPDLFGLTIISDNTSTNIDMKLFIQDVTTTNMPHVLGFLKINLPTILQSTCFNDKKQSFAKEVVNTEIGHLFEHILLEYLCREKINAGHNEAMFSGITKWNWNKEEYGTFHIHIDITKREGDLLYFALEHSILLLKRILLTKDRNNQFTTTSLLTIDKNNTFIQSEQIAFTTKKQMD
jgi:hypothetical protein